MTDNSKKQYLADVFDQMSSVLAAIAAPAGFEELRRLLYLTNEITPLVSKLQPADLRKLLGRMCREHLAVSQGEGKEETWMLENCTIPHLRSILLDPRWQLLPDCVARALPAVSSRGSASLDYLRRDLRNGFYVQDAKLVNSTLNTLRDILPDDYESGAAFDFITDTDSWDWLISLQPNLLAICSWQFLPIAIKKLLPIQPLADRLLAVSEEFPPVSIYPLADYELLTGNWTAAVALLKRCSHNHARQLRQGWLSFLAGQNDKALNHFIDALYEARQKDNHDFYFQTVGGLFFILALIRQESPNSLASAEANTALGLRLREWAPAYEALAKVVQSKLHREYTNDSKVHPDLANPISAFFQLLSEYWLNSRLEPAQQELLGKISAMAEAGGYLWFRQESDELLMRTHDENLMGQDKRYHDIDFKNVPYIIDCVPVRNSWINRLENINSFLASQTEKPLRRLVWYVTPPTDGSNIPTVKPLEQHLIKGVKWSKGRKFTAYRNQDYCQIDADLEVYMQNYRLTPHDKYACTIMRKTMELLEQQLMPAHAVWGTIFRSLIDHPLLFLDTNSPRPITCHAAQPYIRLLNAGNFYEFQLAPVPVDNESIVIQSDQTGNILVYIFEFDHLQLRKLFGQDFRLPKKSHSELAELLARIAPKYTIVSDCPLELTGIPAESACSRPAIRLTPEGQTLRVSFSIQPFPSQASSFLPGVGPCEIFAPVNGTFQRLSRDFALEVQRCDDIIQACPAFINSESTGEWEWLMNSQLDCFELTQQLAELTSDQATILWPEDKSFTASKVITSANLSIQTQSYRDWFNINGEVKIDENLTITLQELLRKTNERNNRFIVLDNGQVIALSEKFRRQLNDLNRFGEISKGDEFLVHRFLIPILAEAMSDVGSIQHSAAWEQTMKQITESMQLDPEIPNDLNANLRQYQHEGYVWLSRLDAIQAGACLADDMGLGKTIQAIALILSKAGEGASLVVAPTSVCTNWLNEFNRFAPSLKVTVFGPGNRTETLATLGPGHVLICSYGLLQSESAAFEKYEWRIAVLDEAQAIKNYHAKRSQAARHIHAKFKLVTTGTPLENNLNELWSIFRFILPGLLGTRDHFQKEFSIPIEHEDEEARKKLAAIIHPFLLRRQKSQVLKELPPKEDIPWTVELPEDERVFYETYKRHILQEIEQKDEPDGKMRIKVLAGITKLRLALCHPSLVPGGENLPGAKLETFLQLLTDILANGHKTLVFSQFVKYLTVVRAALDERQIPYQYLDGNMNSKERNQAVTEFQEGTCPVFLISLKAGGLGLNLTQADYVIHLDSWWNPAVENQASDRAYRYGQDKKVTIYHLVTANTIEERIQAMHEKKKNLADSILDGNDKAEQLSLDMLLKLLKE